MNSIPQEQNSEKQIERLAAQRRLYSNAKKWHTFQILLTVLIPVTMATWSLVNPDLATITSIVGVAVFLIDITIINPAIEKLKTKAAKIQELFDCDVLKISKSPLKTADDITVEEVLDHHAEYLKSAKTMTAITNWYSPKVGVLPIKLARILCQRTNCYWDSKLRQNYSETIKYLGIFTFASLLCVGFIYNQSLTTVTLTVSGLVPFFQFCIAQYIGNRQAADRLNELVSFSQTTWKNALTNTHSDQALENESRILQDEIFQHRNRSPLILDLYYNLFRDEGEARMNRAAEILVDEAKNNLDLS